MVVEPIACPQPWSPSDQTLLSSFAPPYESLLFAGEVQRLVPERARFVRLPRRNCTSPSCSGGRIAFAVLWRRELWPVTVRSSR